MSEHVKYPSRVDIERFEDLGRVSRIKGFRNHNRTVRNFLSHENPLKQIIDDPYERGRANERRASELFQGLADEGDIDRVSRASKRQRIKDGVDFYIYFRGFRIPVQIKSSVSGLRSFKQEHGDSTVVFVVNPEYTDRDIKHKIKHEVREYTTRHKAR